MSEVVISANNLYKEFKLSKKQQKLTGTHKKVVKAVDDLSLQVHQGQIYGLLGPNGAGKTTTLRILATLIKPDRGDATVGGFSVKNEPGKVRKVIGFLTSDLKLEDFFTPNYLFDYFSALHGVEPEVATKRKEQLFDKFGITEFAEVKVANLSSGMRQKVSLVIAIVHDPKIIIFDEPTNGLDVLTAKVVTDFLVELKEQGKSIIISTHIFSLVEKICSDVGIIIEGKMVAEGPLAEVQKGLSLEDRFFQLYLEHHQETEDAANE
ncbi:MAG: ABC transporter ATP-binding protein [Bacilli bacterium]